MKPSFNKAREAYPYRYTMEHVPFWASKPAPDGKFYAPQFRSDQEWYDNTKFPPDRECYGNDCYTSGQTWPLGHWLDAPYKKG